MTAAYAFKIISGLLLTAVLVYASAFLLAVAQAIIVPDVPAEVAWLKALYYSLGVAAGWWTWASKI
jgi:hypothetical protein